MHVNITDPWNGEVHASLKVSNQNEKVFQVASSVEKKQTIDTQNFSEKTTSYLLLSAVQTYKSLKHVIYFETTVCQIHRQVSGFKDDMKKTAKSYFSWAKSLKCLMN